MPMKTQINNRIEFPLMLVREKNLRPRRPGFTLVELMVVVVIIALLGVLLVPLIGQTGAVLRLRCQSNLRELGMMLLQYGEKNNQRLPDFSYSRWCGAVGVVYGGVYSWQTLPDGNKVWFIDDRDDKSFHCPAQPLPLLNTQGVHSSYAGLSIHSFKSLSELEDRSKRVLLFEFEHDPAQVLQSIGPKTRQIYAYDSFEPGSGPLQVARNHQVGGYILFADMHLELVEGPQLQIGKWEEGYQAGDLLQESRAGPPWPALAKWPFEALQASCWPFRSRPLRGGLEFGTFWPSELRGHRASEVSMARRADVTGRGSVTECR